MQFVWHISATVHLFSSCWSSSRVKSYLMWLSDEHKASKLCLITSITREKKNQTCFSPHCVLWQALWTFALFILSLIQPSVTQHHPLWGGLSKKTWSCSFFLGWFLSTSNTEFFFSFLAHPVLLFRSDLECPCLNFEEGFATRQTGK